MLSYLYPSWRSSISSRLRLFNPIDHRSNSSGIARGKGTNPSPQSAVPGPSVLRYSVPIGWTERQAHGSAGFPCICDCLGVFVLHAALSPILLLPLSLLCNICIRIHSTPSAKRHNLVRHQKLPLHCDCG